MGYQPHHLQTEILEDESRFRLVIAGRRWGKSLLAAWEALGCALWGGRVWVIGLTYEQCDRILEPLWMFLASNPEFRGEGTRRSDRRIVTKRGGFIIGKSADHPDSLVGDSLDLAIPDEWPIMPERIWAQQIRPCLSDRRGRGLCIGTPRGHNHAFKQYSRARTVESPTGDPEWRGFRAPSSTNLAAFPRGEDDPEIVKARADAEEAGLLPLFQQEYEASFTALQGRVYAKWSPTKHVVKPALALAGVVEVIGGADWGHRDPCALVVCGRTNDSQWRILDEWYQRGATHTDVMKEMDRLTARWGVKRWWCDTAEPARIAECKRHGLDARGAWKDPGSKNPGILMVTPYLGRPGGFMVSSVCKNFIREIDSYSWDESRRKEETQGGDDHAMDAMRYAIATEERKSRRGGLAVATAH